MDRQSETSIGSYSVRAYSLLDQIRTQTPPEINKEFHSILSNFKKKNLDSQTVHEKVSILLKDYPHLLVQFEECMISQPQAQTAPPTQFGSAIAFVNKIKVAYKDNPAVYDQFLTLFRDFQRGQLDADTVTGLVTKLLKSRPDLVEEFQQFCQPKIVRQDSNDTVAEEQPLLDVESRVEIKKQSKWIVWIWVVFVVLVIVTCAILYSVGLFDGLLDLIQ
ncbi:hypothetical protein HDV06_006794 [Boothiomyces sp. JEL0866]|nr:hypothetical protein HDV06_006794 [Boothiomyces sp. JEL0866]